MKGWLAGANRFDPGSGGFNPRRCALFTQARKKVQALVDRRFNRNRYHSQQLVDRFTTDLRDQTHVDQLTAGLSSVVQETLHPSAVGMWLSDRR